MDLLRHLIIYGAVFKVDLSGFNEFNTILARINKQMSEITYEVKKSGNIHKDEVMKLKKYLDELWDAQRDMLSKVPSLGVEL